MRRAMLVVVLVVPGCINKPKEVPQNPAVKAQRAPKADFDDVIERYAARMLEEGEDVFRYETFGSEAFWGGQLKLHQAIADRSDGGIGEGLKPIDALKVGLKVDVAKVPDILMEVLKDGDVSLTDPDTTLELLRADAVVGVKGYFEGEKMVSVGITCALCHSTVDDSLMRGIGRRLDGWPNRDLDVGKIITMAPNLRAYADVLDVPEGELRRVLLAWGPGKYDAELNQDGKGFRPDGKTAATVLPAAFGLAGVNLHTYTGWGSVTYWNAYVANTQMAGQGTFYDPRIKSDHFPIGDRLGFHDKRPGRGQKDRVTPKLAALHFYQLAIPAPRPPSGSFDKKAARRGEALFNGKAGCARCHVPPLFTEPGWSMHSAKEIGIDDFQAKRSPDGMYRTTPLRGLFVRAKGGFYHDGRFPDLGAVVDHYQRVLGFSLNAPERRDLVEYLKSL
jgi:hypothetical protein